MRVTLACCRRCRQCGSSRCGLPGRTANGGGAAWRGATPRRPTTGAGTIFWPARPRPDRSEGGRVQRTTMRGRNGNYGRHKIGDLQPLANIRPSRYTARATSRRANEPQRQGNARQVRKLKYGTTWKSVRDSRPLAKRWRREHDRTRRNRQRAQRHRDGPFPSGLEDKRVAARHR